MNFFVIANNNHYFQDFALRGYSDKLHWTQDVQRAKQYKKIQNAYATYIELMIITENHNLTIMEYNDGKITNIKPNQYLHHNCKYPNAEPTLVGEKSVINIAMCLDRTLNKHGIDKKIIDKYMDELELINSPQEALTYSLKLIPIAFAS